MIVNCAFIRIKMAQQCWSSGLTKRARRWLQSSHICTKAINLKEANTQSTANMDRKMNYPSNKDYNLILGNAVMIFHNLKIKTRTELSFGMVQANAGHKVTPLTLSFRLFCTIFYIRKARGHVTTAQHTKTAKNITTMVAESLAPPAMWVDKSTRSNRWGTRPRCRSRLWMKNYGRKLLI